MWHTVEDAPDIDAETGEREPDEHELRLPVERVSSGALLGWAQWTLEEIAEDELRGKDHVECN